MDGKCSLWGKPAEVIEAYYSVEGAGKGSGPGGAKSRRSLLLTSGWWGISRHFHYVPEILAGEWKGQ